MTVIKCYSCAEILKSNEGYEVSSGKFLCDQCYEVLYLSKKKQKDNNLTKGDLRIKSYDSKISLLHIID